MLTHPTLDTNEVLYTLKAEADNGKVEDFSSRPNYHDYRDMCSTFIARISEECSDSFGYGIIVAAWLATDVYVLSTLSINEYLPLYVAWAGMHVFPIVATLRLCRLRKVWELHKKVQELLREAETVSIERRMDIEYLIGKLEAVGQIFNKLTGKNDVQIKARAGR